MLSPHPLKWRAGPERLPAHLVIGNPPSWTPRPVLLLPGVGPARPVQSARVSGTAGLRFGRRGAKGALQVRALGIGFNPLVCGSDSALPHAGLLVGLRVPGAAMPLYGLSVRRHARRQAETGLQSWRSSWPASSRAPGRSMPAASRSYGPLRRDYAAIVRAWASVAVRTCPLSCPPRRPLGRCALPSSGRSVPCRA